MKRDTANWFVALGAMLMALVVVGVPVWLIRPFAAQTPAAIEWSWRLRQAAPGVTLAAALLVAASALVLWWLPVPATRLRRLRRLGIVGVAVVTVGAAWFARQNHFEWKFRPFPDPRFVAVSEAAGVPAGAPVLGVSSAGAALAFPITRLGYHHLVNATLGDVPIVATY